MINPIPGDFVVDGRAGRAGAAEVPSQVLVAYDAFESGDPRAMSLLVGLPATVGIGSDSYGVTVVKTTAKTITVNWGGGPSVRGTDGRKQTFRLTKRGWTNGSYRLAVGFAHEYRDPSF